MTIWMIWKTIPTRSTSLFLKNLLLMKTMATTVVMSVHMLNLLLLEVKSIATIVIQVEKISNTCICSTLTKLVIANLSFVSVKKLANLSNL
jgi:hypothetical protein